MAAEGHTSSWPDLTIGLYDRLTGRNAEITSDFDNVRIKMPSGPGGSAEHTEWVLTGAIKIRTQDLASVPN